MAIPSVSQFLLDHALLKQNGEYEFLYALAKDEKVSNNLSLAQLLDKYDDLNDLEYYENTLVNDNPLLSIFFYVPNGVELSENITISSKIFANTLDDDLDVNGKIPFYVDGTKDYQSSVKIPQNITIVIKDNERIVVTESENSNDYYLPIEFIGSDGYFSFHKVISKKAIPYDEYIGSIRDKNNSVQERTVQRD